MDTQKKLLIKGIVASGMVLQQNKINCIFGTADIYEDILMTFRGITSIAKSDENGNWKILLCTYGSYALH